jgi:mannose-6-phosphate isomerase-like protein (cupin superfamily)
MGSVFSVDDIAWIDLEGLPGARGFEFKALTNDAYTKAYSCELVRLGSGDHSVPHIEPWSHLLYVLSGTGDITIDRKTSSVQRGTVCQVRAGETHSLRNLGDDNLLILAIYDPPRKRIASSVTPQPI